MMQISPSLLAADFTRLGEEVAAIQAAGADMLHLDVMDGRFVQNISFGIPVIASLRKVTGLFFDTHLMIADPLRYIDSFAGAGSDRITFHLESESDVRDTIAEIRRYGKEAGISIRPGTSAEEIFPYLELVDLVLIMTVEPGFGGQAFMPDTMPKVRKIYDRARESGVDLMIQVDGGINLDTAFTAAQNGANVLVAGSSVFAGDYAAAIKKLRESGEQGNLSLQ